MTMFVSAGMPAGVKVFTISEVASQIRELLEEAFPSLWLTGEISNLARPASGHVYFSLKDSSAQIAAVIWRGNAARLRFQLKDGLEVVARGHLSSYAPRSQYQIQIDQLLPKGVGELELAFQQLKAKLSQRGWFDPERKKPLPRFPRRIALVTSPTGAVIRDMLRILLRRWPAIEIVFYPVAVQGEGAAREVAQAIQRLNQWQSADVVIVGRGGGSMEDLWSFNEEVVAEAIYHSRIPVISAVGHETDFTIADFVADRRAATPSEAAEIAVPDRQEVLSSLTASQRRMTAVLMERIKKATQYVNQLAQRRALRLPLERLRTLQQLLDEKAERLQRGLRRYLEGQTRRLQQTAARLDTLSPLNVLRRGYSLTVIESCETLLRAAEKATIGTRIVTQLAEGKLVSRVEEVIAGAGKTP
jgi:exodeoxyribonuclease VII large subunit